MDVCWRGYYFALIVAAIVNPILTFALVDNVC
jgi:hypothetical protein